MYSRRRTNETSVLAMRDGWDIHSFTSRLDRHRHDRRASRFHIIFVALTFSPRPRPPPSRTFARRHSRATFARETDGVESSRLEIVRATGGGALDAPVGLPSALQHELSLVTARPDARVVSSRRAAQYTHTPRGRRTSPRSSDAADSVDSRAFVATVSISERASSSSSKSSSIASRSSSPSSSQTRSSSAPASGTHEKLRPAVLRVRPRIFLRPHQQIHRASFVVHFPTRRR